MADGDKIGNKIEDLGGKAKETVGNLTGDDKLQGEGKADQAKAAAKDAVEDVKDAVSGAVDKVKGAFDKD